MAKIRRRNLIREGEDAQDAARPATSTRRPLATPERNGHRAAATHALNTARHLRATQVPVRLSARLKPRRDVRAPPHQPLLADHAPHRGRTRLTAEEGRVSATEAFQWGQPPLVDLDGVQRQDVQSMHT